MNQEIKTAVASMSTIPPSDADEERFAGLLAEPVTLATIVAALACCPHPERCRVPFTGKTTGSDKDEEIAWCAACGAMTVKDSPNFWQPSSIVCLVGAEQLDQVEQIERVIRLASLSAAKGADHASASLGLAGDDLAGEFRDLENALKTLATLALFSQLKRASQAMKKESGQ